MLNLENHKYGDLIRRILFTIGALIVYRLGAQIPIPGVDPLILANFAKKNMGGILGMFDMFSGGALSNFTIFALNLMPYITASIIIQILSMSVPQLEALRKDGGPYAKRLLNKYTKYLAIVIGLVQSYSISVMLISGMEIGGVKAVYVSGFLFISIPSLMAGTFFLIWLSEQITARGISNGSSMIIFAGIVAHLPASFISTFELGRVGSLSLGTIAFVVVLIISIILLVVFVERSYRKLLIHHPGKGGSAKFSGMDNNPQGGGGQYLPLKINSAGVIPPIFANAMLSSPLFLLNMFQGSENPILQFFQVQLSHGKPLYIGLYVILIVLFSFIYTSLQFNPKDIADNIKKGGGFIPGLRPGDQTAQYIDRIITRLTAVGATYLSLLCILPEFLISYYSIPFYFGGTSILIIVGVCMDTVNQISSHLLSHRYSGFVKRKR